MNVTVSGIGYVGLVTGVALSYIGHKVTCVDVDKNKISKLQSGVVPIYEPHLKDLMSKCKNKLLFTTDCKSAYKNADIIIIGVGTPEREDGSADLSYVYSVCEQIAEVLENDCVVVLKSTVPIGTSDLIEKKLNNEKKHNVKIYVVSNPEFLSQGTAIQDTLYASRIVVGTEDKFPENIMRKLYEPLTKEPYNVPYLHTSRRSAEMIKYASNDFLALKISYVNEIANLCKSLGANIEDVTKGMGYDLRIGDKFLKAGIGYGGSCFPKDTKALHWLSISNGIELKTIKACIEVNENQKLLLFRQLKKDFNNLCDKTISILGLTFKPNTDDLRDAPSIVNIVELLKEGATINLYDPVGIENFKLNAIKYGIDSLEKINFYKDIDSTIQNADAAMIMTEWPEIMNYDVKKYKELMKNPRVYDGRNCYKLDDMKGIYYFSVGR